MIIAETGRLRVRHLRPGDAPFVRRLLNEPSFLRYIGDKQVRTLDDARAYLESGPLTGYAAHGFSLNCVECATTGVPMGICGVLRRATLPDPDLGYAFLPEFWSLGYAREAAAAVLHHARVSLGLSRILAITTHDNVASIRLLEDLGFTSGPAEIRMQPDNGELRIFVWSG